MLVISCNKLPPSLIKDRLCVKLAHAITTSGLAFTLVAAVTRISDNTVISTWGISCLKAATSVAKMASSPALSKPSNRRALLRHYAFLPYKITDPYKESPTRAPPPALATIGPGKKNGVCNGQSVHQRSLPYCCKTNTYGR